MPRLSACAFVALLLAPLVAEAQGGLPLDRVKVPPGFRLELVAMVPAARAMTFGRDGTLFVGSTRGDVHAVSFPEGRSPVVRVIARGLREPAGVAFRDG